MARSKASHLAKSHQALPVEVRSRESTYALKRRLESHRVAERWLGVDLSGNVPLLLYKVDPQRLPLSRHDVHEALRLSQTVPIPHTLRVGLIESSDFAGLWLASPYAGSPDGIMTLGRLLASKDGGRMEPCEARRAAEQLLSALIRSHALDVGHGPVRIDDVLVDRRGRTFIELFALESYAFGSTRPDVPSEVRGVVEIAYELVTGIPAQEGNLDTGFRMAKGLSKPWKRWLRAGLSSTGYESAREALSRLPRPGGL